jgi:hypothetical protein
MYDTLPCTIIFLAVFEHSGAWIGASLSHGGKVCIDIDQK